MRLNGQYVLERRRQLGLSLRELSRLAGIGVMQVKSIEHGVSLDAVSLRDVTQLAAALSCSANDLLDSGDKEPGGNGPADDDVAFIGACLMSADRAVPIEALCDLSRLSMTEVLTSLERLDAGLQRCGLRVRRLQEDGALRLVPGPQCSGATVGVAIRAALARNGLNDRGARIVFQAIHGQISERDLSYSPADRVEFGRLVRAGILEPPEDARTPLGLSAEARFSLLFDD